MYDNMRRITGFMGAKVRRFFQSAKEYNKVIYSKMILSYEICFS